MTPRVVAIVQARTGSTRLPRKVLADLEGAPVLARCIDRTIRASLIDTVVVATSTLPADDVIVDMCRERGWSVFRGSESDVLSRYHDAAIEFGAEAVVRVTSDCPLADPAVIDDHARLLLERWHEVDFVTNMLHESFPLGLAVEAMPFDTLARMHRLTRAPEQREHVTSLAYDEPHLFVIAELFAAADYSSLRWTVDTAADLGTVREIYRRFGHDSFSWQEVLAAFPPTP